MLHEDKTKEAEVQAVAEVIFKYSSGLAQTLLANLSSQGASCSFNLGENDVSVFGPLKLSGRRIVTDQIIFDRGVEVIETSKHAPLEALLGERREPTLDQIQPRAARRREVQLETKVLPKPVFHGGGLMSAVVVDNDV